jgi:ubiquinone/menaquinone biosynthesis C-methylase UbiE
VDGAATAGPGVSRLWDAAAGGHALWRRAVEPALAPVDAALLEVVDDGAWVLDVCCGAGEAALAAARRVGPRGRVVGIDLAPRMLAAAEARAREQGVVNAGFQLLDAARLAGWPAASYDAALSRFGLAWVPDLDAVVRGLHHVLVPGGRVAVASWGAPDAVPLLEVARRAIAGVFGDAAPLPEAPGPHALGRPGRLEQLLSSRGFARIEGRPVRVAVALPSADAYVELLREATPLGAQVAERADDPERVVAAWRAVAAAVGPGAPRFECGAFVVSARRA